MVYGLFGRLMVESSEAPEMKEPGDHRYQPSGHWTSGSGGLLLLRFCQLQ
jgi:hypothetical protein